MNRTILSLFGIIGIAFLAYFILGVTPQTEPNTNIIPKYASYSSPENSLEFAYPIAWGDVTIQEGNKVCPQEDTYFSEDTLHVSDSEYVFTKIKLPDSESFISTGVRLLELDPKRLNKCGGKFHYDIAIKKINPESLSSVRLSSLTNMSGLIGIYNEEASRLDTTSRRQYTYFIKSESGNNIYVLQPYMVFTPYFGSPELKELEEVYDGNMAKYLQEGQTATRINEYFADFKILADGIKFIGE